MVRNFLKRASDYILSRQDPYTEMISSNRIFGIIPIVHHYKLYYDYFTDPGVHNAVNTFRDQVTGVGYYLTADDKQVLEDVNKWLKKIKFKRKLDTGFTDALITGNMMFEKIMGNTIQGKKRLANLELVDMRIVKGIKPNEDGTTPISVVQNFQGAENEIPYENISHFKLFEISRSFLGIGLFHSLAVPQYSEDNESHSILDDMKQMRSNFAKIIHNHANPDRVVIYEDETNSTIKDEATKWENRKAGDIMFTNKKFEHVDLTIDGRSRFEKYIDTLQTIYELGTQTPAAKLQTTTGFTEASANAALQIVERRIKGIQENLKSMIEEDILNPYITRLGYDAEKVNLQIYFGQPDIPEYDLSQIIDAGRSKGPGDIPVMTRNEVRKVLQESGIPLDVDGDEISDE